MDLIYHITPSIWWNKLSSSDAYESETLGAEGFIHCSTRDQVSGVLERYFAHQKGLLLLHINPALLKAELKYEVATQGESFPHVYGMINKDAIVTVEGIENIELSG